MSLYIALAPESLLLPKQSNSHCADSLVIGQLPKQPYLDRLEIKDQTIKKSQQYITYQWNLLKTALMLHVPPQREK